MDPNLENNEGEEDLISKLPDPLLASIISFLPINQAVKTSMVSRRFNLLWKITRSLNFDMLNPNLINFVLENHNSNLQKCKIVHHIGSSENDIVSWLEKLLREKEMKELSMECDNETPLVRQNNTSIFFLTFDVISHFQVLELKNYVLKNSLPNFDECPQNFNLTTLKLSHVWLTQDTLEGILSNCLSLEKLSLIECKLEKGVKIHSKSVKVLELVGIVVRGIDVCAVKLSDLEVDTMICKPIGLAIKAPKLRVFHSRCDLECERVNTLGLERIALTTREILETCSGFLVPAGAHHCHDNVFKNLVTLWIDMNLNTIRDAIPLSFVLGQCLCLENLQINNKVMDHVETDIGSTNSFGTFNNLSQSSGPLLYPNTMFWERELIGDCVSHKLKKVYIAGYKGKGLDMEFFKYLITKGRNLERITICFDDNCTWKGAVGTLCLLSLARASQNLSITLKPGKEFLAKVGGSMGNWISSLKLN